MGGQVLAALPETSPLDLATKVPLRLQETVHTRGFSFGMSTFSRRPALYQEPPTVRPLQMR